MKIDVFSWAGDFGENKDVAARVREDRIRPCVKSGRKIILDFDGVTLVTQSFIHALLSDVLRTEGEKALEEIEFKNCVDVVRGIISTVVQYSLDTLADENEIEVALAKDEAEKRQYNRFKEAARQLETDDDEERFEERLKRLARQKPKGDDKSK